MRSGPAPSPVRPKFSTDAVLPKQSGCEATAPTTDRINRDRRIHLRHRGNQRGVDEAAARLTGCCNRAAHSQSFQHAVREAHERLRRMTVYEAEDGQQVLAGHVYIAPGDRHLMVVRRRRPLRASVDDGVPVNRHKPSVDVLFRSVAQNAGRNAIGVILTGMGKDGAKGSRRCWTRGARQSRRTRQPAWCGECRAKRSPWGAAQHVIALDTVAGKIRSLADSMDITRQAREA